MVQKVRMEIGCFNASSKTNNRFLDVFSLESGHCGLLFWNKQTENQIIGMKLTKVDMFASRSKFRPVMSTDLSPWVAFPNLGFCSPSDKMGGRRDHYRSCINLQVMFKHFFFEKLVKLKVFMWQRVTFEKKVLPTLMIWQYANDVPPCPSVLNWSDLELSDLSVFAHFSSTIFVSHPPFVVRINMISFFLSIYLSI